MTGKIKMQAATMVHGNIEYGTSVTIPVQIPCIVSTGRNTASGSLFFVSWDVPTKLFGTEITVTKSGNSITITNTGGQTCQYAVIY